MWKKYLLKKCTVFLFFVPSFMIGFFPKDRKIDDRECFTTNRGLHTFTVPNVLKTKCVSSRQTELAEKIQNATIFRVNNRTVSVSVNGCSFQNKQYLINYYNVCGSPVQMTVKKNKKKKVSDCIGQKPYA